MDTKPKVFAHGSYIGKGGYNQHTRDFFRHLSKLIDVKVRNFAVDDNWTWPNSEPHNNEDYVNEVDKKLLVLQTLWINQNKGLRSDHIIYPNHKNDFKHNVNILLQETNHNYFWDAYEGPKIGYNVWESTVQPQVFFDKWVEFDQLWVPSKWQAECTVKQGADPNKVKVVPEGVDINTFYPDTQTHHDDYDGRFKFILFGRWDYRKSTKDIIRTWIDTFSSNENVELILSVDNFDNPQDNFKNTQERLIAYGLNDKRISIVSYSDRNTYINRLKNSDVFLSCSRGEGWNLPLIEAMACGIPVIYSECGGQLEYTKGFGFGVKIKHEVTAWKEGIGNVYEPDFELLSDTLRKIHSKYERVKKRAIIESDRVRKEYDWSVCGKLGTNYLTRVRKFSEQINPTFVTHVRPHENLESLTDNWIPKINRNEGKFMTKKTDWNDVFICNGKDPTLWGRGGIDSFTGRICGFKIFMRNDLCRVMKDLP